MATGFDDIITLDEFLALKVQALKDFADAYRKKNSSNRTDFPLEMKAGAWLGEFSVAEPRIIDSPYSAE